MVSAFTSTEELDTRFPVTTTVSGRGWVSIRTVFTLTAMASTFTDAPASFLPQPAGSKPARTSSAGQML